MYVPVVATGAVLGGLALVLFLITPWWLDALERHGRLTQALDKQTLRRSLRFRAIGLLIAAFAVTVVGFLADR